MIVYNRYPSDLVSFISRKASAIVAFTFSVIGSMIIPLSLRFTFLTWSACFQFIYSYSISPALPLARAIARLASVTVSIAAERIGMLSVMLSSTLLLFLHLWVKFPNMPEPSNIVVEREAFGKNFWRKSSFESCEIGVV